MAETAFTAADGLEALTGGDMKEKMRRILPILAGPDGKKLMALLYLSGSSPQNLREALEKAGKGDGREISEIMARLLAEPEGEAIMAKLITALKA